MFKKWYVWLVIVIAVLGGSAYGIHSHNEQVKADRIAATKAKEKKFNTAKKEFLRIESKVYSFYIDADNDMEGSWEKLIENDSVEYKGKTYTDFDSLSGAVGDYYYNKIESNNLASPLKKQGKILKDNVTSKNEETLKNLKQLDKNVVAYAELIYDPTGSYTQVTETTNEYYHRINSEFDILE